MTRCGISGYLITAVERKTGYVLIRKVQSKHAGRVVEGKRFDNSQFFLATECLQPLSKICSNKPVSKRMDNQSRQLNH
ncbi:hypothetical protein Pla22_33920 [Rubripirellula amarantea]|uniref:Uncharacterized protein n=1 Tax=Rubripirellula amarantea TaxID=2527999 RepID=A0A5C5WKN1_9BACT|nr:hypothetical protein [Rubripirellula amarantea]TWT50649.1 hypothetical protein Pla22_33920 [Rubripirellula amarantea]